MRSTGIWSFSICPRFVLLFVAQQKTITHCLHLFSELYIPTRFVSRAGLRKRRPWPAMTDSSFIKRRPNMFISRKHLSRRTVLKGAGVTLALPFLEAMVPAATAMAQTAASPKMHAGFFYIPHGAIMGNTAHGPSMDRWTPSGTGADLKLNAIMQPLEPFKKYVSCVGSLVNDASAGSVHTLNPATWLSCTRPGQGAGASLATTIDQLIAKKISQDTTLPSLEISSETTVQQAAGNGGFYTTLSFRDAGSPLPMEHNPKKVFNQLFGETTPKERVEIARQTDSLLDLILAGTKALQNQLGASDRATLDAY